MLQKVIPKLIQCDQTAYVGNLCIEANCLISDMSQYTGENEIEAMVNGFEKAFDSFEHTLFSDSPYGENENK